MLLTADIGNTNINFAIFQNSKIVNKFVIPTKRYDFGLLKKHLLDIEFNDAIICSVVPKAEKMLESGILKILGHNPFVVGKSIKVPIKNLYRKPKQVGQDRLVNAFAASSLYGAPLIAIDFGTAITFDVISKNKEYLGGMILPGLRISLEALAEKTALLPEIKLEAPTEFIGKETKTSVLSGLIFGMASLTDDLSQRIKAKIGRNAKVIATGGNIKLISRYCKKIDKIDPDLTLKGLYLIYRRLHI
ncbi:MAG: type III pantothenate kinase [Candidatus Omnitrophica bacterium]|nr:type III pantothenate kinase [Candidatus Omnitrophota bacterium]